MSKSKKTSKKSKGGKISLSMLRTKPPEPRKKPGPKAVTYTAKDLDKPLRDAVFKAVKARTDAQEAKNNALRLTQEACKRLAKGGVTIKNTSELLDLSMQRVIQLRA